MTTPHRATPEQWESVQLHADPDANCHRDSCILELHYRVEALEAAQQPTPPSHPRPGDPAGPAPAGRTGGRRTACRAAPSGGGVERFH